MRFLVIVGSAGGTIFAVDSATGAEQWRCETEPGGAFYAAAAVIDGVIYAGSHSRTFFALGNQIVTDQINGEPATPEERGTDEEPSP